MLKWAITAITSEAILVTAHTGAFDAKPWKLLNTAKFE